MSSINLKKTLLALFVFFLLFLVSFNLGILSKEEKGFVFTNNSDFNLRNCPIEKKTMIVRGNSLAPLIDSGQEVEVLFGYYDCYPVCKEEVSLLKYAGNETYLIKIIKGLPGDEFKLVKNNRRWNLYINGSILKNSEGKEYFLSERDHQMLSLYERDYNNKIPKNVYLVLGNKETGSLDSTRFGLIDKSNIVAKVEL